MSGQVPVSRHVAGQASWQHGMACQGTQNMAQHSMAQHGMAWCTLVGTQPWHLQVNPMYRNIPWECNLGRSPCGTSGSGSTKPTVPRGVLRGRRMKKIGET